MDQQHYMAGFRHRCQLRGVDAELLFKRAFSLNPAKWFGAAQKMAPELNKPVGRALMPMARRFGQQLGGRMAHAGALRATQAMKLQGPRLAKPALTNLMRAPQRSGPAAGKATSLWDQVVHQDPRARISGLMGRPLRRQMVTREATQL